MLSNLTLETLEKKQAYLRSQLKAEGRFLSPAGMKVLNSELSKVAAMINEAKHRHIVGVTDNGANVYLASSEFSTMSNDCLYIEGLPTGWDAASFFIKSGESCQVVVDADQNWSETITFK